MNYNPHLNKRNEKGNKGTFGQVLVIAGNESMSGCVYFCAMAALRSGCGMVNIFTDRNNIESLKVLMPEAIFDWFDNSCNRCSWRRYRRYCNDKKSFCNSFFMVSNNFIYNDCNICLYYQFPWVSR